MAREINDNPVGPTPKDVVHLIHIKYWDGSVEQEIRLTDAIDDIDVSVDGGATTPTWVGTGLLLGIGSVDESADLDAPGVDISFDGVNQSIISVIANNQFRGRPITIWRMWLDPDTGAIASPGTAPVQLFDGYQNSSYTITESFSEIPDAVTVSTRAVGAISSLGKARSIKTNTTSHREMLEAAGLATTDTFFQNVPGLAGQEVYWGRDQPSQNSQPAKSGSNQPGRESDESRGR